MNLVAVALLRELASHPWQLILTLFSIAAGVAIVVGVDVANSSAMREFSRANAIVDGVATHRITGGENGINQDIYRLVKVEAQLADAAPVIRAEVRIAGIDRPVQLLGIDPLSDFRVRQLNLDARTNSDGRSGFDLSWPVFVSGDLSLSGESVQITDGVHNQTFNIAGVIESPASAQAGVSNLLVTDIAWAQSFLKMQGRISHIALRLPGEFDLDGLDAMLPESVRIMDLNLYNAARLAMTKAFRINLTALSLLALVIAMFLVYSIMSFQMIRRNALFALLRSAGVTGRELALVLFGEVALVAAAGSLVGVLLGALLASGLSALVTDTINALYYSLSRPGDQLTAWTLGKGLMVGLGASATTGALPIFRASGTSVRALLLRSTQEQRAGKVARASSWIAAVLAVVGIALLLLPVDNLLVPFAGLFLAILSGAALAPITVRAVGNLVAKQRFSARLLGLKMALMNIRAHLSRTAVAIAALTVAVSATLGVGLMIDSFRYSVERWMENYLRADIYMTRESAGDAGLAPAFVAALESLEGVRAVSTGTRRTVQGETDSLTLFALDTPEEGFAGFQIIEGNEAGLWPRFRHGGEVLITEPLSRRLGLGPGDAISIPTDRGDHSFAIAAVYRDYSTDRGLVAMDWRTYRQHFDSERIASAALYLESGADTGTTMERVRTLPAVPGDLFLRSNMGLRNASLAVFDQTFRITDVLRWLSLIVAVVGIVSALMALQLERSREYAILKAVGFTRFQLAGQMLLETGLTGLWAGVLAIPMGFFLAVALINVINVRSFGWSMATVVDWSLVSQAILLSILAAALAGLYPALRLWRTEIAAGLRNE